MHLPGHSFDSLCVYHPKEKVLVAGDTVLRWATDEELVIPYFYWGSSVDLAMSLDKILKMDIETVIPGHGGACKLDKVREQLFYVIELKRLFDNLFEMRPSDEFAEIREFLIKNLTLEVVFGEKFIHRNWVEKSHRLNIERLIIEEGIIH